MATREEKINMFKLGVATYVSFMVIGITGLPITTSIAFSSILVQAFGATWKGIMRYSINRVIAQIIGVTVGYILYKLIFQIDALPEYQKYGIAMTGSVVITIYIRILLKLDIADFTVFTPGLLLLLMTPNNSWYPLLRLLYVVLGCTIGIIINFAIFPPKKQSDLSLQEWVNLTNENMRRLLVDPGIWSPDQERLETMQAVEVGLAKIQSALSGKPENELEVARHRLNSTSTRIMREISQCVKDRDVSEDALREGRQFLEAMFSVHSQLLNNPESIAECKLPDLKVPDIKNPADIMLWSKVIEGYDALQQFLVNHNTAVKRISARLEAQSQKDQDIPEEGGA